MDAQVETRIPFEPPLGPHQQYAATASVRPSQEHQSTTYLHDFIQSFADNRSLDPEKLLHLTPDDIRSLSVSDYINYLHLLDSFEQVDLSAGQLEMVAERFAKDISEERDRAGMEHLNNVLDIGQKTTSLLWLRACLRLPTSPDVLEKFYSYIDHRDRTVRLEAVEYLEHVLVLDAQNEKDRGEGRGLGKRFEDDLLSHLLHPTYREDFEVGQGLVDVAWAAFPGKLPGILVNLVDQAASEKEIPKMFPYAYAHIMNRVGLEEGRKHLRSYAAHHPEFREKFAAAENRLGFAKGKKQFEDIRKLYPDLDFTHYKPNEDLLRDETDLLLSVFGDANRLLDMGHGPSARHMHALEAHGKKVTGFDYVGHNIGLAKAEHPELQTAVASWHHMPFAEGSFDGVYSLGRSLLHNTTTEEWLQTFGEMHRVLGKAAPGKKKIAFVDIPWLGIVRIRNIFLTA